MAPRSSELQYGSLKILLTEDSGDTITSCSRTSSSGYYETSQIGYNRSSQRIQHVHRTRNLDDPASYSNICTGGPAKATESVRMGSPILNSTAVQNFGALESPTGGGAKATYVSPFVEARRAKEELENAVSELMNRSSKDIPNSPSSEFTSYDEDYSY